MHTNIPTCRYAIDETEHTDWIREKATKTDSNNPDLDVGRHLGWRRRLFLQLGYLFDQCTLPLLAAFNLLFHPGLLSTCPLLRDTGELFAGVSQEKTVARAQAGPWGSTQAGPCDSTPLKLSLGAHDWRGQDYVHLQQGTELGAGMW